MAKYIVTRPWSGVQLNQVVELEVLHPALKANVMPLPVTEADAELEVSTPKGKAKSDTKSE